MKRFLHISFKILAVAAVVAVAWPLPKLSEVPAVVMPEPTQVSVQKPFAGTNDGQVEAVLRSLTLEQKIGQLILWKADLWNRDKRPSALQRAAKGRIGGILLDQLEVGDFLQLTDTFQRSSPLPLFVGTEEKVSLHGQFFGLPQFPAPVSIAAIDSAELQLVLEKHYLDQCHALGINLSFQPTLPGAGVPWQQHFEEDQQANYARTGRQLAGLAQQRIVAVADGLASRDVLQNDTLLAQLPPHLLVHTRAGLSGLRIPNELFDIDSLADLELETLLRKGSDFNGLAIAELGVGESPLRKLSQGADQLVTADADFSFFSILQMVQQGELSERQVDEKVRRILLAKAWVNGGRLPVEFLQPEANQAKWASRTVSNEAPVSQPILRKIQPKTVDLAQRMEEVRCYFEHPAWPFFIRNLYESSAVLASNRGRILPFWDIREKSFTLFEFNGENFGEFESFFAKYADFKAVRHPKMPLGGLPEVKLEAGSHRPVAVVLLDGMSLSPVTDAAFIESVNELADEAEVVVVNFGNPANLQQFVQGVSLFQIFERNEFTESYAAQALFGGLPIRGKLPMRVAEGMPFATSEDVYKNRLSYGLAERSGVMAERLVGINAIAETAVDKRAFPGCQVVVAKGGNVIFSKAFGYHSYSDDEPVLTSDLYDIASITKVASTTLSMMKLYDQQLVSPSGKLGSYLDLHSNSTLANVRVKNLMIHYSGLPPSMPIGKYFNYRNVPGNNGCNDIFCRVPVDDYNITIVPNLFFRSEYRDTIWQKVFRLHPSTRRFRYSDVNFYLLQKIVEETSHDPLDAHVDKYFYRPLGLRNLTYNPLQHIGKERIVPTERDMVWRKALVHGYVHDPSAALMGGVGGNAGIFSSAEDLAVVFQMLINDGLYGGVQFLQPGTVGEFTTAKYGNHRGLGFDKPVNRKYATYSRQAPKSTFGHNGFTGTCVWADPDNDLVYVFLSNRIHPSANNAKIMTENVRARIHEVVYQAFNTFDATLPVLGNQ